jgi:hypothetical protein
MAKSCLPYLTVLQQHGLTSALLERFACFCEAGKVGSFVFHTGVGGEILAYEEHHKARVQACEERSCEQLTQKRLA